MSMSMETQIRRAPIGGSQAEVAVILTVIVSSYNTRRLLLDCLASIYANPPSEPYEIVVVDDASRDGSSAAVRAAYPEVRLLVNEANQHYTHSNNRAIGQARGRFLLLLNSDTLVLPNALDEMIGFLKSRPACGVVGCKLLNEDMTLQWSVKSYPGLGSALFGARSPITRFFPNNPFSRKYLPQLQENLSKPLLLKEGFVSGAASMIPRAVVDEIGLLDPIFFYHVDADYCKRITEAGYECYYLPSASIIHLEHRGGTMVNTRSRFRALLMFELYNYAWYRKHLNKSSKYLMEPVVIFGLGAHFLASAFVLSVKEVASKFDRGAAPSAK